LSCLGEQEIKSYDGSEGNASRSIFWWCPNLDSRFVPFFPNQIRTLPIFLRLAKTRRSRFAEKPNQWDNKSMTKLFIVVTTFLAFGLASADAARAQQTSAPAAQQSPATSAPAKPAPAAAPKSTTGGQASTTPKTGQGTAAKRPAAAATPLATTKQKASYALGQNIGKGLQKDGVEVDSTSLARGLRDAMAGNKSLLTDEEAKAALTALATEVRAKQQAKLEAIGTENKQKGDEFLAANKSKEGVVALPSGLQYKILKEGSGPKPTAGDKVTCNYSGTLIDGKEFDSSYKRGQPVTFSVGEVIKGWNEALQLMPVGSKWQLVVPPDLAYGDRGAGQDIGPKSTLVFEVELLSIAPKTDAKPDAKPEAKPEAKPDSK
jgi:FKBP-type peptidyl-prolyl cis-trans isomerase